MNAVDRLAEGMVEHASVPAFAVDTSLRLIAVNESLLALLRRTNDDLRLRACTTLCAGPGGACEHPLQCPAAEAFRTGQQSLRLCLRCGDGEWFEAEVFGIRVEDDETVLFLCVPAPATRAPGPESGRVVVRALGSFDARLPSGDRVHPRRPQALTVLKLLLCARPNALTEAQLIRALWPAGPPRRAPEALRVLVHDLRRALEPGLQRGHESRFVTRTESGYRMPHWAPLATDVDEFERRVAAGAAAAAAGRLDEAERELSAGLDLYRGDLFAGDEPAEWFARHRRQLRGEWLNAVTLRAALLSQRGEAEAAIVECERAIHADLGYEKAQQLLLLILARHRGRAAATERFVDLFREFKQRFGIPPSRETAELVERLAAGEPLEALEREFGASRLVPAAGEGATA